MPIDENLKSQVLELINSSSTQVADAASQLLNSPATLTVSDFTDSLTESGQINITEPSVNLSASTAHGNISVIIDLSTALALAAQMMGAEATEELDDTQKEALSSLVTQSFTSSGLSLEGLSEFSLTLLDPANPDTLKIEAPASEMTAVKISLSLESGLSSELTLEFSLDLANALADSNNSEASENATINDERNSSVSGTDFAEINGDNQVGVVDEEKNLNLLMDIRMGMIVELGRAEMHLKDILKLTKGSIIELDRLSGEAVDLFVNNKLIARGEVVVIDDNFGLRITQLAGTKGAKVDGMELLATGD